MEEKRRKNLEGANFFVFVCLISIFSCQEDSGEEERDFQGFGAAKRSTFQREFGTEATEGHAQLGKFLSEKVFTLFEENTVIHLFSVCSRNSACLALFRARSTPPTTLQQEKLFRRLKRHLFLRWCSRSHSFLCQASGPLRQPLMFWLAPLGGPFSPQSRSRRRTAQTVCSRL